MNNLKEQFPIFKKPVHGQRFCYLDTAASAQKPLAVIEHYHNHMTGAYSNIHRGSYRYSEQLTQEYESARAEVAKFIGAENPDNIVFTSGATMAINLVAHSYGRHFLKKGDKVLVSVMEHHANLIPWQILRDEWGVELIYAGIDGDGNLLMEDIEQYLPQVKFLALTHASNTTAVLNPVKEICAKARKLGVVTLIDGAQGATHNRVNVTDMGCDFYILSGHKLYAPTGIGVLYGRTEMLEKMPPFLGGGDMIRTVGFDKTTYAEPPARFEAGTPPILEAIGLGVALKWLMSLPIDELFAHEAKLNQQLREGLQKYQAITLAANPKNMGALTTFFIKGAHPHDVATLLDQSGVAIRAGHHCTMILHKVLAENKGVDLPATARVSFGIYSDEEDLAQFFTAFDKALKLLKLT